MKDENITTGEFYFTETLLFTIAYCAIGVIVKVVLVPIPAKLYLKKKVVICQSSIKEVCTLFSL